MKDKSVGSDPIFVEAILERGITIVLAKILLVSAYILGGMQKLLDFQGAVAEQVHFGMSPPAFWACLTIFIELLGSILFLTRRFVWLGAGMLGVFTALAALKANNFWTLGGQERFAATNAFFEHLGLIGGFIIAAILAKQHEKTRRNQICKSKPDV